ncbi:hypothetical protein K3495_g3395 [Podosphaera aphanis]|nr:hypothetical protein K3495_g3395 [Podosphaera aphanis]
MTWESKYQDSKLQTPFSSASNCQSHQAKLTLACQMPPSTNRKLSFSKLPSAHLQPSFQSPHPHPHMITPPTTATLPSPSPLVSTLPGHINQLRPPKLPLYMPAVLRPTDPPKKRRKENLSAKSNLKEDILRSTTLAIAKKSDVDVNPDFSDVDALGLGKVSGPPTRIHWKPDLLSTHCDLPSGLCTREFTTFHRRHHCRRCGLIFCHSHSLYSIPLDQDANFHPRGTRVRACENCWSKWVEFSNMAPRKRQESDAGSIFGVEPLTPVFDAGSIEEHSNSSIIETNTSNIFAKSDEQISIPVELGASAQSVPRDWHWSTF